MEFATTLTNTSGAERRFPYVPANGHTLADGASIDIPGLLETELYLANKRGLKQLRADVAAGRATVTYSIPGFFPIVASVLNKDMTASVTAADFDEACATAVVSTPSSNGYVQVMVNGVQAVVGDGVKTEECYFSDDAGVTAKAIADITAGDKLYWVGSVAGFELDAGDRLDFNYSIV
jgi:hypothetical protein